MRIFSRNGAGTILGLLTAGGVITGITTTWRGEEVEVRDCDAGAVGPRFFGAREDADGLPILANVDPSVVAGRCQKATPYSWTDSQSREWFLWKCICEGNLCCTSLDHAQYLGSTLADLKAKAATLGGKSLDKTHFVCALDPQGCTSEGQPAPCRKPVVDIPVERRPPEAEWFACNVYAAPFNGL